MLTAFLISKISRKNSQRDNLALFGNFSREERVWKRLKNEESPPAPAGKANQKIGGPGEKFYFCQSVSSTVFGSSRSPTPRCFESTVSQEPSQS